MSISSAALTFFLVMDPLGNIPLFLAALGDVEARRQGLVVVRELLIALAVMVVFLFVGQSLLATLHISEPALSISGGVILFLIALRMVFPVAAGGSHDGPGEPFIVPLAIPYVAGPSVLTTELLLMSREPARWPEWLTALALAWAGSAVILILGSQFRAFLGRRGLVAIERLMGLVLVAIAVQMFLSGIEQYVLHLWQLAPRQ